ncbi:MAG TPA: nucleotidyltransferase family protein [Thermoleophilaceae bacterium]|nr:nucleotidyltransferase family protein [Thermoleophilaceae bacterium]
MQVMLLAAGRGTRLGELGRQTPKVLVEIGGKPLLARQFEYLARQGADRVVVNAHHLAEQILDFVGNTPAPFPVDVVVERELLGTAGGLRNALPYFRPDEPVIVLNGDTLLDAPLCRLLKAHLRTGASATIGATRLEDTTGKGVIEVDGAMRVTGFEEKPVQPRPGLANAGLYAIERELATLIPRDVFFDFAHDLFPLALDIEADLRVHELGGEFADIGTPESLAAVQAAVA